METYRTRSVPIPERYKVLEGDIRSRERHTDVIAVSWVVLGVFYIVQGLVLSGIAIWAVGSEPGMEPGMRWVLPILAVLILLGSAVMSLWHLLTAWGLHRRKSAARISSWVIAALLCLTICLLPLGIYAYWVLVGNISDMVFGDFPDYQPHPVAPPVQQPQAAQPDDPGRPRVATPVPPRMPGQSSGTGSVPAYYPRPGIRHPTPPAGIPHTPQAAPSVRASAPGSEKPDITTLPTVNEMPNPMRLIEKKQEEES